MSTPTSIEPNSFVVLDYVLRDDDGEILDSSSAEDGEQMEYIHGYGMIVPGLEAGLVGLKVGEERVIVVPSDEAYGEYDEDLVMEIDRADLPDPKKVEPGDEFMAETPDGDEVVFEVKEVGEETVVVDANHPLAGMTLHYAVKVISIRGATDEEIEMAAEELDEAHEHVHGPDCAGHDHPVTTIGKKTTDVN